MTAERKSGVGWSAGHLACLKGNIGPPWQASRDRRPARELPRRQPDAPKPNALVFSGREVQVLTEVRHGLPNKKIATRLGISLPGVRFHLANIYRKTGVNQRDEAVRIAQAIGVVD